MVLYHLPGKVTKLAVGLVLSLWRGVKQPKLTSPDVPLKNCFAARVVKLAKKDPYPESFNFFGRFMMCRSFYVDILGGS